MPTTFNTRNTGDSILANDVDQFIAPVNNLENGKPQWAVGTSGTNTYTATVAPAPPTLNAAAAGYWLNFKVDNNSTGAATLTLNGGSAKSLKTNNGTDPTVGTLVSGSIYALVFDGTNWIIT